MRLHRGPLHLLSFQGSAALLIGAIFTLFGVITGQSDAWRMGPNIEGVVPATGRGIAILPDNDTVLVVAGPKPDSASDTFSLRKYQLSRSATSGVIGGERGILNLGRFAADQIFVSHGGRIAHLLDSAGTHVLTVDTDSLRPTRPAVQTENGYVFWCRATPRLSAPAACVQPLAQMAGFSCVVATSRRHSMSWICWPVGHGPLPASSGAGTSPSVTVR